MCCDSSAILLTLILIFTDFMDWTKSMWPVKASFREEISIDVFESDPNGIWFVIYLPCIVSKSLAIVHRKFSSLVLGCE